MNKQKLEKIINIQTEEVLDTYKISELADNALLKVKPELWTEWNFEKNNELNLDIYKTTCGSNKKARWIGKDCGHEWEAIIGSRSRGSGCPYCSNSKVLKGYNDMWTTNPEQASLLVDTNDGYKYTQSSNQKVDWCCPNCKDVIKNKRIADVNKNRLYCQKCNKGKSVPEMFMYYSLLELGIEFEVEKTFDWSDGKRYDFYIPDYSMIIEIHGEQHYSEKFNMAHRISLDNQIINDNFKKNNAINNIIDYYIVIEARKSNKEYLTKNIIDSLSRYINRIESLNFNDIYKKSMGSRYKEVCDLWNNGLSKEEISKQMKLPLDVIVRYLRRSAKDKITSYIIDEDLGYKKSVVQLDSNYRLLKTYQSLTEAANANNVSISNISSLCRNKKESENGFYWMYEDDYNFNQDNLNNYGFLKYAKTKKIVQLSFNGEFIKEWKSVAEACRGINEEDNVNIGCAMMSETKLSNGYRWLYKEDYDKYKNELSLIIDFERVVKLNPVIQLSLDGNFIKEWDSTKEASDGLGLKNSYSIVSACKGLIKSSANYRWMYKQDYERIKDSTNSILNHTVKTKNKPIIQLTKDGIFIKEWESATEASKQLNQADSSAIHRTLKGKSKTSGGFKWMYKEDYENYSDKLDMHPLFIKNTKKRKKMIGKEVVQLDLNNNMLRIWISLSEAARENNISNCSSISKVCRGIIKSSAGYKWMFKDEYDIMIKSK